MELLYIWLPEYKNFKEQGFNFSSEYIFKTERKENQYELTISKNPNYIPDFFGKSNVSNVTAIIGQNGSGKSNILDFIKASVPTSYFSFQNTYPILVIRKGYKKTIFFPRRFDLEYKGGDFQTKPYYELSKINFDDSLETIYYSNIFDLKPEQVNFNGFHNISTRALLQSDKEEFENNKLHKKPTGGEIAFFTANEIRRNIEFLSSDFSKEVSHLFPLPDNLIISIRHIIGQFFSDKGFSGIQKLLDVYEEKRRSKTPSKELFKELFYISCFFNFVATYSTYSSLEIAKFIIKHFPFDEGNDIKEYIKNFFNELPNLSFTLSETGENIPFNIEDLTSGFIEKVEALLEKEIFKISNTSIDSISFNVEVNGIQSINEFIQLYERSGILQFLDFNWRNLSSGEQSMLTLMSRFHYLKHHTINKDQIKENLIILIDEGDIFFHPEWQRKFFKIVLDYLSELFKDHQIQLIFTSNTPFITSDLPKSNVIFIEKTNGKSTVHGIDNDREETFAGNIHTLLSDSFYMEGALMGDFAKEKVNELIKKLKAKKKPNQKQCQAMLKTINQIGEPLLKNKLLGMWEDRFGVEDELERLKRRIKELESKGGIS